ncbi:unnamed protein product [Phytomonas sp. Hart1]|nr:unnamed protein product [Phytomonas sp. Hart1]|eukprot:CCW67930.1 unnamed protein product [Phytomonas sp. isolate Hart1]
MMRVTQDDLNWFNLKLKHCEGVEIKLFYLARPFQTNETEKDEKEKEDPLGLACGTLWTLDKALRAARLIVCDGRSLWERVGGGFLAGFSEMLNPWNEQNAVKIIYQFLSQRTHCAGAPTETRENNEEENGLWAALEGHAIKHIKPQQLHRLCSPDDLKAPGKSTAGKVIAVKKTQHHGEGGLVCRGSVGGFGELFRLPRSKLFYRETVLKHCDLGVAVGKDPRLVNLLESVEVLLVMGFLYELHLVGAEHSHWRELLLSCPRGFPTVPLFWYLGDLCELAGMDIFDIVLQQREESEHAARAIELFLPIIWEDLAPMRGEWSFERFKTIFTAEWIHFAKAVFNSRAFNLNIDGDVVIAMVPLADMLNHQNLTDVLVRKVESGGGDFVMLAGAPLEESEIGRELWMSYGPLQNWELLYNYGFVLPQNVHDRLPFPLQDALVEEEDVWGHRRRRLIEKYHLCVNGECWLAVHGVPCEALLALLRLHLAQPEEFDKMESKSPFIALSVTTELNIVQTVENVVKSILEQFPDSLDDDKAALAKISEEPSTDAVNDHDDELHALDNYMLCLRLRIGLKEIAYRTLQWCKETQTEIEENHRG